MRSRKNLRGWKIVALLRLNPLVPFNLQNYFFGVTDIGFWPYAAATFFGIMPGALGPLVLEYRENPLHEALH